MDPRNKPSMDLFTRFGFMDEGPDPDDPEYHLLSLEFTPQERGKLLRQHTRVLLTFRV